MCAPSCTEARPSPTQGERRLTTLRLGQYRVPMKSKIAG